MNEEQLFFKQTNYKEKERIKRNNQVLKSLGVELRCQ